jgi:hypothetical protein|tara:strand:+ start:332 stop:664 length:333 start_codon:yes stop_codon:yes gene_type:complete
MAEIIYHSSNKNDKNLNKATYMYCHSVQLCVSSITLVLITTICCIAAIEFHNITHVIHSFNSNIKEDINNVNDFLTIIPDLDKAVHMILQLCNLPEVEPFCNQTTLSTIK